MIKTECPKCKTELTQYDGYGACPKCGELVAFDFEEEKEEILDEVIEEITEPVPEEVQETVMVEVPSVVDTEPEEEPEEESQDVAEEIAEEPEETVEENEDITEEAEEVNQPEIPEEKEETKAPKKGKKAIITVLIILIMCALAVSGWYFAKEIYPDMVVNTAEETQPEGEIAEEEPKAIEEPEEEVKEEVAEETQKPAETPAPVKQETTKKPTVKKEDAVISPTPSISYRIRKSADDSDTQIGAFSDIEKAKAFAASHSADGYKVYDMSGNVVFEP